MVTLLQVQSLLQRPPWQGAPAGSESVDETYHEEGMVPEDALIQLIVGLVDFAAEAEGKARVIEMTIDPGQETQQQLAAEAQVAGTGGQGQSATARRSHRAQKGDDKKCYPKVPSFHMIPFN